MQTLMLMVQVVASHLGYRLLRLLLVCRVWLKGCLGRPVEHERFRLESIGGLWRHAIELDGVYRFHIDLTPAGAFELFWRHHSGIETPADVYPSFWQALVAMAPQIERYLAFSRSGDWTTA